MGNPKRRFTDTQLLERHTFAVEGAWWRRKRDLVGRGEDAYIKLGPDKPGPRVTYAEVRLVPAGLPYGHFIQGIRASCIRSRFIKDPTFTPVVDPNVIPTQDHNALMEQLALPEPRATADAAADAPSAVSEDRPADRGVTFRVPPALYAVLQAQANARGCSVTRVALDLVRHAIAQPVVEVAKPAPDELASLRASLDNLSTEYSELHNYVKQLHVYVADLRKDAAPALRTKSKPAQASTSGT